MSDRPVFYPWTKSEGSRTYSRQLTVSEHLLALLNDNVGGHSYPSIGAEISVKAAEKCLFDARALKSRVKTAFIATRRTYPTVAFRIKNGEQLQYVVEKRQDLAQWAERTVVAINLTDGCLPQYEAVSKEPALPNEKGDCAILYLVVNPEQSSAVQKFELLLRVHHTLVDGAGLRSIMNELLTNLVSGEEFPDDREGDQPKLHPAALDAAIVSDETVKQLTQLPKEIQLPELPEPVKSRPGTGSVAHTFKSPHFRDDLKALARTHNVKLASLLQASLVTIIYEAVRDKDKGPASVVTGYDLPVGNIKAPWSERSTYVGPAVGMEMMEISRSILDDQEASQGIWSIAQDAQQRWTAVGQRKDAAAAAELRKQATGFILNIALEEMKKPADSGFGLALNFVSDPPGEKQFDGTYESSEGITFELEDYQIVTDASPPKLSGRAHSWRNILTLQISFSNKFNNTSAVQTVLDKWAECLSELVVARDHVEKQFMDDQ